MSKMVFERHERIKEIILMISTKLNRLWCKTFDDICLHNPICIGHHILLYGEVLKLTLENNDPKLIDIYNVMLKQILEDMKEQIIIDVTVSKQ
jgi:hypothetical protein